MLKKHLYETATHPIQPDTVLFKQLRAEDKVGEVVVTSQTSQTENKAKA